MIPSLLDNCYQQVTCIHGKAVATCWNQTLFSVPIPLLYIKRKNSGMAMQEFLLGFKHLDTSEM